VRRKPAQALAQIRLPRRQHLVLLDLIKRSSNALGDTIHRISTFSTLLVSGRHHALCAVDATRRALRTGIASRDVAGVNSKQSSENVA